MDKDNLSSHAYYHFISFVKEIVGKVETKEFAIPVQTIIEKIKYKNKSYVDILKECNCLMDRNEKEN